MRFLCVSSQLNSHLDWGGYLPTAFELMRTGHDLLWATGRELRSELVERGIPVHVLPETGWRWPPPPPIRQGAASEEDFQRLRMTRLTRPVAGRGARARSDARAGRGRQPFSPASDRQRDVHRRRRHRRRTPGRTVRGRRLACGRTAAGFPRGRARSHRRTGPRTGDLPARRVQRERRQLGAGRSGSAAFAPRST